MKGRNRTWYQLSIVVAFIFLLFVSSIFLVEKTGQHLLGAVVQTSGTNATLTMFDDAEVNKTATIIKDWLEVNNLFNGTSNVYFYANYTNATGQSMVSVSGTACAIEFEAGASGNTGPFAMIANTTLNVWEYNRSFPRNGTFMWNVTCSNANAGTATLVAYDSVRIFGPGCTDPTTNYPNTVTNNTILCGGTETLSPPASNYVFTINNNNITLDCNNTLFRGGNNNYVVDIGIFNGTIIKNCLFENYSTAINSSASTMIYNIVLFNNSFANMSVSGIILAKGSNFTIHSNNFTRITSSLVSIENITNISLSNNYFCNNGAPTINIKNSTYSATNNTLCITLRVPANNTEQNDINFTFDVPSLSFVRTCNLLINDTPSGAVSVAAGTETAVNLTVNRSYFAANRFNWQVNCSDTSDNKGSSVIYNTTYRTCTVPADNAVILTNITLCPGTYFLNDTGLALNGKAAGIICNNTLLKGDGSATAIDILSLSSDGRVVSCYISGFLTGINAQLGTTNRLFIVNNTFNNISSRGMNVKLHSYDNITNNSFRDVSNAIFLQNTYNHSIDNNLFYNCSTGIRLRNATDTNIRNNNVTNMSHVGAQFDTLTPLTNRSSLDYTVSGNYFCGISDQALIISDYVVSHTLNGIIAGNTFCNTTDSLPNGAIADVLWTTDVQVLNNTDYIDESRVAVRNIFTRIEATQDTNATGDTSFVLLEFNISADNLVTYLTPHQFIANHSLLTKTVVKIINESRTILMGNQIALNISNPDSISNLPGGRSKEAAHAAKAARAARAAQQAAEQQEEGEDEDEEEEIVVEQINYTYMLLLKQISLDNEAVFENNQQGAAVVFKDYESYTLSFVVENNGTANLSDIVYSLEVPSSLKIISQSISRDILLPGESAVVIFTLETADIIDAFSMTFHAYSSSRPEIDIVVTIPAILEEGKGELYSTRQKIIEETQAIITRTYEFLFLLFLIPLLLLLRVTTIADEKAVRRMIDDKKMSDYWRIYVPEEVYLKYNMFQNLCSIKLEDVDIAKANQIAVTKKIPYQLATAIIFAQHCLFPRIFTFEELSVELRHSYPRIYFTSPLRNYKEDQLKRYIKKQQQDGFTNNEIRETLLAAHWSRENVKKYLPPEDDLKTYIAEQQKKGRSLGELRKELLDVKWDKSVVDGVIPRDEVLKEYITGQRRQGKTNAQIKTILIKAGWEKESLDKYLNVENDLKAYITFQQHRGFSDEQIKTELLSAGWKEEVVVSFFK